MFKQVFRLTFITFIWKKYKRLIVSTLLLIAYLWIIGFAHSEYLSYAELQNQQEHVGSSFFIKWIAMLVGVVAYFLFYFFFTGKKHHKQNSDTTMMASKKDDESDPFDAIRKKDKLRSKAEMIIDKHK